MGNRATIGLAMAIIMVLASVLPSIPVVQAADRLLTTPDGPTWSDDVRVTDDPSPDLDPYLFLDDRRDNQIVWQRNNVYMYEKLGLSGKILLKDREIKAASPIYRDNGQLAEAVGIDGDGGIHIIKKKNGASNGTVIYERFANDGRTIVQPIDIDQDIEMAPGADLVLAPNHNANIIYDHYPTIERKGVSLDMIDPKGNLIKVGVALGDEDWFIEGVSVTTDHESALRALVNVWEGPDRGVWALKLDQYGVVPANIQPQFLYETIDHTFPYMPKTSACPDGGLAVLRYLDMGSYGKLTYMMLNEKNEPVAGQASEISITTDATKDMDVACDSRGVVHVVFSEKSTGKLHYSKIIDHKVTDPARITSEGTAYSPRMVFDKYDFLHLTWVDDRDGNKEIYYKLAFSRALELSMGPQETAKLSFIHCEEIKSSNLTIKNLGAFNETILLNTSIDYYGNEDNGWDAFVDEDEIILNGFDMASMQLYVKGPTRGRMNDFIEITVTATLEDEPSINDTLTLRIFTCGCSSGIRVDIADNVHMTMAGEVTEFVVSIRTDGGGVVALEVSGNLDWDRDLSETEFFMDDGDMKHVNLRVSPPKDASCDEIGDFTITGYMRDTPTIRDRATTHTIVSCSMAVSLDVVPEFQVVNPFESQATVDLIISNEGNTDGYSVFIVELVSGIGDLEVILDRTSLALLPKRSGTCIATIFFPSSAIAGTRMVYQFEVFNEYRTVHDKGTAIIEVGAVHDLVVDVGPKEQTVEAGGTLHYDMIVSNRGNCREDLKLPLNGLPVGWFIEYVLNDTTIFEISIGPGESVNLIAELRTAIDSRAGEHTFTIVPTTNDRSLEPVPLTVNIEQIFLIDVWMKSTKQVGLPGGYVTYSFTVSNHGNGLDTVSIDLLDLADWEHQFIINDDAVQEIYLQPQESTQVELNIDLPKDVKGAWIEFDLVCNSSGGQSERKSLGIEVDLANLEIASVGYSDCAKNGKPITISVEVANTGKVLLQEVVVSLFINGEYYTSRTIGILPVDSVVTVIFEWVPKKGDSRLVYFVDPDDQIMEVDEEDNRLVDRIGGRCHGDTIPGFEAVFLLIGGFLALLVVRRRRASV